MSKRSRRVSPTSRNARRDSIQAKQWTVRDDNRCNCVYQAPGILVVKGYWLCPLHGEHGARYGPGNPDWERDADRETLA